MIILHNNTHGGIIRVCMRIFTTTQRNKTICQILNKNTSPYFHSVSLVIWPLSLMKRTHFSELSISRFSMYIRKAQGWTLHFRTPDLRSKKSQRKMTRRPPRVLSYGVVPSEAKFKKETGLPSWFLMVMCQGWCVCELLEAYKLEIFEANCSLALDARGRLSLWWIEMKLQYMCLDSVLDLWLPGHFAPGFFASEIGGSEMECSALGFSYVCWKPRKWTTR